ncbi:MFS transporter [Streptomyces sp. NBC_00365]|uniref:MFS transporter n=1 Tax=Streptomyces sp. NBC_00365 TaxID=2975726 RepID=UPI002251E129|nr:MFS transporter [Streptomyces sp. NBC_00365]MCX5097107.1 MFS transporter [Streptomyces sp. NBC_00365]
MSDIVTCRTAPLFAARFGPRTPVVTGQLVMAARPAVLRLRQASAPIWMLVALMVPIGAGGSLALPSVAALLRDQVPAERAGTGGGVLNASRQLGGALAVAVFGALAADVADFHDGLRVSLRLAALLVLLATAVGVMFRSTAQG